MIGEHEAVCAELEEACNTAVQTLSRQLRYTAMEALIRGIQRRQATYCNYQLASLTFTLVADSRALAICESFPSPALTAIQF